MGAHRRALGRVRRSGTDPRLNQIRMGQRFARHAGIRVLTTSADRLALETLEAYLARFRRAA